MGSSNGLVGGIKDVASDEGLVATVMNIPAARGKAIKTKPTSAQIVESAFYDTAKFFRDSSNLEQACLHFFEVRGAIKAIPFWSSEFDKANPTFPDNSIVVTRDEIYDKKTRGVAATLEGDARFDEAVAIVKNAWPELISDTTEQVIQIESAYSYKYPTLRLLRFTLRVESALDLYFASGNKGDTARVGLHIEDGEIKVSIAELNDETREQFPSSEDDVAIDIERSQVKGDRDALRDCIMDVLVSQYGEREPMAVGAASGLGAGEQVVLSPER